METQLNNFESSMYEAVKSANSLSLRNGKWSNIDDIFKELKKQGHRISWSWNREMSTLNILRNKGYIEQIIIDFNFEWAKKIGLPNSGFETVYRDSKYRLAELQILLSVRSGKE